MEGEKEVSQNTDKFVIAVVIGVIVLLLSLFGAYRYSQMYPGSLAFPGGTTYLGPSPTIVNSK